MTNKLLFSVFLFSFMVFGFGIGVAEAQVSPFPSGCASALGYSATTGEPCNGTDDDATDRFMPGCNSALGYSASTGEPCSGGDVALSFLAGCTSVFGFSSITGEPCNGTFTASIAGTPPTTVIIPGVPALPFTGMGGEAFKNLTLLAISGMVSVSGATYLTRRFKRG